jgi:hypothetical protein
MISCEKTNSGVDVFDKMRFSIDRQGDEGQIKCENEVVDTYTQKYKIHDGRHRLEATMASHTKQWQRNVLDDFSQLVLHSLFAGMEVLVWM